MLAGADLTLSGGIRHARRDADSSWASGVRTGGTEAETENTGGFLSLGWRPSRSLRLTAGYEDASYSGPFTLSSPTGLRVFRFRGQDRLRELTTNEVFLAHMNRVRQELDRYMDFTSWYERVHADALGMKVAYFSAECGIHECLPLYSGGLGILAGDHLKSASDLGLPLTVVGLCYRVGYMRQYLNRDGWQQETMQENDFYNLPMSLERKPDGMPYMIQVELPGRPLYARIWRVQVGRVPLFLLDANVLEHSPADREITNQLNGGDNELRLKQEILLGIGGVRALVAMGIEPTVYHMNEGHSAFLALERIALFHQKSGLTRQEAKEAVHASTVSPPTRRCRPETASSRPSSWHLTMGNVTESTRWFTRAVELNPSSDLGLRAKRILDQHASITPQRLLERR